MELIRHSTLYYTWEICQCCWKQRVQEYTEEYEGNGWIWSVGCLCLKCEGEFTVWEEAEQLLVSAGVVRLRALQNRSEESINHVLTTTPLKGVLSCWIWVQHSLSHYHLLKEILDSVAAICSTEQEVWFFLQSHFSKTLIMTILRVTQIMVWRTHSKSKCIALSHVCPPCAWGNFMI